MQDTELYRHLLGLQRPWSVARVQLAVKEQRVDVWAEHAEQQFPCPECRKPCPVYDHAEERVWRHLDSCQFMTHLHARIPRVDCEEHGVRQVAVPWAEPRSRFTALFERLAIDVLREASVTGATRILRISWDEAMHIMRRAVSRGLLRKKSRVVARIGVDEKSAAKGHKYLTLISDLDQGTIEGIEEDRHEGSLAKYFSGLSQEQLASIQAVAMDMWQPFVAATMKWVPGAEKKIVFDRFHVMMNAGRAVDLVRRQEHSKLRAEGTSPLTKSKHLWLYAEENLPAQHREHFDSLKKQDLMTAKAWALKENLRRLWTFARLSSARRHFSRWYGWAIRSGLFPMVQVAKMLQTRLQNVLTYFQHPITNAVSEGINSKIQTIKKRAYGFRNKDHFKMAIYFHCGGLELYPTPG